MEFVRWIELQLRYYKYKVSLSSELFLKLLSEANAFRYFTAKTQVAVVLYLNLVLNFKLLRFKLFVKLDKSIFKGDTLFRTNYSFDLRASLILTKF